jgi:pimeloyl-ACP methyl ester carboxylesterase
VNASLIGSRKIPGKEQEAMRLKLKKQMSSLLAAAWLAMAGSPAHADGVRYKYATVDGIRIFYREAGDPSRPTLLLLHGFPTSSHMFRDLMPRLAGHFHLVAPDYPGMGYSDAPPAEKFDANDDSLTTVTEHFVQQLGDTRVILYMQDLGGPIGMRLATKHPDWVAGLIFQNTPISLAGWDASRVKGLEEHSGPVTPEERAAAQNRVTVDTAMFLYRHGARDPDGLNPDAWAADAYALSKPENRRIMAGYLADARLSLPLYPAWQSYLRAQKPRTLVVWGKRDPVFSERGIADIQNAVPGAEVHLYDTGHFALEEDGEDIARQIIQVFAPEFAAHTK